MKVKDMQANSASRQQWRPAYCQIGEAQYANGAILLVALEALPLFFTDPKNKKRDRLMKYEPLAKSLIATSLALSCLMAHAASVAPVAAENGMVVTAQHLATHVGVDVLKSGGNAVDAAVAVGYALAVVYPAAGNLGGGGFMTIQLADGRKTFLDFREKAPLAATANMYLDKDGNVVPDLSTRGHLAVGIPGTVSGMEMALTKYGTKPRKEMIAPAIKLAEEGFELQQGDVELLEYATDVFKKGHARLWLDLSAQRRADAGRAETGAERSRQNPAHYFRERYRRFL
jgi:hypothetical protein